MTSRVLACFVCFYLAPVLQGAYLSVMSTSTYAGVGNCDTATDVNGNLMQASFRYPTALISAKNGTLYMGSTPYTSGAVLRIIYTNGSTRTSSLLFSTSQETLVDLALSVDESILYALSSGQTVYTMSADRGYAGFILCGAPGQVAGVVDGPNANSRMLAPTSIRIAQNAPVSYSTVQQYVFLADSNSIRRIGPTAVDTVCGSTILAQKLSTVDGPCSSTGSFTSIAAIEFGVSNDTNGKLNALYLYVVQADGLMRKVEVLPDGSLDSIVTIGPLGIVTTTPVVAMTLVSWVSPATFLITVSEGVVMSFTDSEGIQYIGSYSDGWDCVVGPASTAEFRRPLGPAARASKKELYVTDYNCCVVSNLSSSAITTGTLMSFAVPYQGSDDIVNGYTVINGVCYDDASQTLVLVLDAASLGFIFSDGSYQVVDGVTGMGQCAVIRQLNSPATGFSVVVAGGTTLALHMYNTTNHSWTIGYCGKGTYGSTDGKCDQATFTGPNVLTRSSLQAADDGLFLGDSKTLRYVTGRMNGTRGIVFSLFTAVDVVVGVAASNSDVYVAHKSNPWLHKISKDAVKSVINGSTTASSITAVPLHSWTNYFNPDTTPCGFVFANSALFVAMNSMSSYVGVILRLALTADGFVDSSTIRRVAGTSADVFTGIDPTVTPRGARPLMLKLINTRQMVLTEQGTMLVVPDSNNRQIWRMGYVGINATAQRPNARNATQSPTTSASTMASTSSSISQTSRSIGKSLPFVFSASTSLQLSATSTATQSQSQQLSSSTSVTVRCDNRTCNMRALQAAVVGDACICLCFHHWSGKRCELCPVGAVLLSDPPCSACRHDRYGPQCQQRFTYSATVSSSSSATNTTTSSTSPRVTSSASQTRTTSMTDSTSGSGSPSNTLNDSATLKTSLSNHSISVTVTTSRPSVSVSSVLTAWTQPMTASPYRLSLSQTQTVSVTSSLTASIISCNTSRTLSGSYWTSTRNETPSRSRASGTETNASTTHSQSLSPSITPTLTLSSATVSLTETMVVPPPPTVAPRVITCEGPLQLLLSYNHTIPFVASIIAAQTQAYLFTIQVVSCHKLAQPLTIESAANESLSPFITAIVTQTLSMAQKKISVVVGPLGPLFPATSDVRLDLFQPNESQFSVPPCSEVVWLVAPPGGNITEGGRGPVMPTLTIRLFAQSTALDPQAVAAMQIGVASVTVVTVVVSSPALAGSAQRQALLSNVANCPNPMDPTQNTLSPASHPLQFPIGRSIARYYFGSFVGDMSIMIGILLLHAVGVALISLKKGISLRFAWWIARFPMQTFPVMCILLQSTLSGALVTVFYSDEWFATLSGLLAIVVCVSLNTVAVRLVLAAQSANARFVSKPLQRRMETQALEELADRKEFWRRIHGSVTGASSIRLERAGYMIADNKTHQRRTRSFSTVLREEVSCRQRIKALGSTWTRANGIWCPVFSPSAVCMFGNTFEEMEPKGRYFIVCEQLQNIVSVAILSYVPDSLDGCWYQFVAVLLVITSYAAVLIFVRPYLSRVANMNACVIAILQTVAAWTLFIAFDTDNGSWMRAYSAMNFATLAVQLFVALQGVVKALRESKSGSDALSRGLTVWGLFDWQGKKYLEELNYHQMMAKWPSLDPLVQYLLDMHPDMSDNAVTELDVNAEDDVQLDLLLKEIDVDDRECDTSIRLNFRCATNSDSVDSDRLLPPRRDCSPDEATAADEFLKFLEGQQSREKLL